jgi:hypothetical protein
MEATKLHDDTYTLADSCLLVRLEQRKISTRKRADKYTEARIRQQENDDSLTINRHLFKTGPVRDVMVIIRKAYDEHKAMTAPWVDKGPRLLPSNLFDQYAETMERYKDELAQTLPEVLRNWQQYIASDIQRRTLAGQRSVSVTDYPSQGHAARAFSIEWYCEPVPQSGDFRVDVPEYIKQRNRDRMELAIEGVRADLLRRLLDPLHAAAERLSVPIGEKGAVFRDSLIGNLRTAVEQARALNVGADPAVSDLVNDVETLLRGEARAPDALRNQQQARENAVRKLRSITDRFKSVE